MQSAWLLRALALCAATLVLENDTAHGFMVTRRSLSDDAASSRVGSKGPTAPDPSVYASTETRNLPLESSQFSLKNSPEISFVESSSDDDDDDDGDKDKGDSSEEKKEGSSDAGDAHKGHEGGNGMHEGPHDEGVKDGGEEDHGKGDHQKGSKGHKRKKDDNDDDDDEKEKRLKRAIAEKEHIKHENLLTSPQEQSKFIRSSMKKAASASYKAMKKLIKVMDSLNGVVALLDQLIRLAPPGPPFSETVIIESAGKKLTLKGILDEAAKVRAHIDGLFIMLLSAKHSIIGSVNRAIPAPQPTAAAPAK